MEPHLVNTELVLPPNPHLKDPGAWFKCSAVDVLKLSISE